MHAKGREREKRREYADRVNQGRLLEEAWLECLLTRKGTALNTGVPVLSGGEGSRVCMETVTGV